jgi:hypothetical protein
MGCKIWYWRILWRTIKPFKFLLKLDIFNSHFTWRLQAFLHASWASLTKYLLEQEMFPSKVVKKRETYISCWMYVFCNCYSSWDNNKFDAIHLFIHSVIHQWPYSPLLGPGLFFSFVIFFTQTVGLPGQVISLSQGSYLHTGQYKHRINTHRHPCLEWDLNPPSQRSS